jgi:hypothetical protein
MRIGYPKNLLKLQRECNRNETIRQIECCREELRRQRLTLSDWHIEHLLTKIRGLENKLKEGLDYENKS